MRCPVKSRAVHAVLLPFCHIGNGTIKMKRRNFISMFAVGTVIPMLAPLLEKLPAHSRYKKYLRPPGARPEKEFVDLCIGCGQCANVCPNKCITMHGLEAGLENLATPKIVARAKGCVLCMACTQVCPTDALIKLEPTEQGKLSVNMGKAFVAEDICYSFAGRTCGACYRACPLPGKAMTIGLFEKPYVHREYCVGCGLCEQACIHMPQAVRIIPADQLKKLESS
jgi:MauM/NapG family ferredoxin protein